MKVLVIGGGGREHALVWRLGRSASVTSLLAAPGNPGIAQLARCFPGVTRPGDLVRFALEQQVDLTIVGPEAPLVAGVVDQFRAANLKIVGPTQAAARLEGSKVFAKQFFRTNGIPTARSIETHTFEEGKAALKGFPLPVVIKADGLAAGKGVIIAQTLAEAESAIEQLGPILVIEEHLSGEEVSFIGLSDGKRVLPFAPAQDHKRIFDADQGPNTGGMGAYCDSRILTSAQTADVMENVMQRAAWGMQQEGTPFTGFLFAGLMLTSDGPKLLEFNVRLGDPETQCILHAARGDFLEFLNGDGSSLTWDQPSVCVVAAAAGYPATPRSGDPISGIEEAANRGATVFHAGTATNVHGELVTAGGRVLGITASGPTLDQAIATTYRAAEAVHFSGMQMRRDIGQKGLKRW